MMDRSKEVIIIGGGISGLGMAVQLKRLLGHDNFTIYEKSENIGGTCFALKHDWTTTMYPGRDELHSYFFSVAEQFTILPHCRFNKMCIDMTWDNGRSLWVVTFQDTHSGEIFKRDASVIISAIGTLDRPATPPIEGADTSFKSMLKYMPVAARFYCVILAYQLESTFYSFYMDKNGAAMRQRIREATYSYIEEEAPLEYREILKPDYESGCKRRVNTNTYLKCLHSPQMLLTKDPIVKIGPDYVETKDGEKLSADAIIYATGFQTQEWLFPMKIRGVGGKDLHDVWDASGGAEAYKGTVVSDFPNFFILYGPNAATGQHSVIFHSECQIKYSCRLLRPVLKGNTDSIAVKPEAQRRDLAWVHDKLQHLVFNSGCTSWWMDPVTKKNTFIYPDPMYKYWLRTIFPRWSDFTLKKSTNRSSKRNLILGCLTVVGIIGCVSTDAQHGIKFAKDAWFRALQWVSRSLGCLF